MKVLGLIGSPRVDGNTTKLVNAILEGAAENGAEVRAYNLSKLDINPCEGCTNCRTEGKCVIDDDMQQLYEEVQAADAVVLGSPLYMWEITAQTKLFVDRLVALLNPDLSSRLKVPKKLVLAYTQGAPDPDAFKHYFAHLEGLFSFMNFDVKGSIVAAGTYTPEDILQQPEILAQAKEIGKNM
ncbi:flavodoxin family protein [Methanosarcina sp. 1.H.A.2.2]|uniref:flavodoxin family protein n=1 Tax=Methanosarcina sp. 1.H.A.2.2 TaxID=1483601 RepID=UPI0006225531|nr:flavodoxin family protein [Methanosarcina sp. 1.H.A.2.2]KKH46514.1 flavodoxin [Methanosarcina sp. 1.H.A.2.2]